MRDERCDVLDLTLGYTIHDDGVHLTCGRCGWDHVLGFQATPRDALAAAEAHRDGKEAP